MDKHEKTLIIGQMLTKMMRTRTKEQRQAVTMYTTDIILLINCSLHPIKVVAASNYASTPAERSIKRNCDSLNVTMNRVLTV